MMRHFGLTLLSFAVTLSLSTAYAKDKAPPYATTPVDRFYQFDRDLYRGGAPQTLEQMKALKKLGIKTIVNMEGDKKKIASEAAMAKSLGMKHVSIPLPGFGAPKDNDVEAIQKILTTSSLKPVFLHCAHGRERTGIEVAIYRVFTQGWTPKKAYAEAVNFGFRWLAFPMKDYFEEITHTDL